MGIGRDCRITCTGGLTIGNDVILGPNVTIVTNNHTFSELDQPIRLQRTEAAPITIEDDVWLGAGVIVTAGVTIGRGAVVAAGAVVTRDVAPYDVVVGVPARRVANRRAD